MDTKALLNFLAENGHKASKNKLQLVKTEVHYLGHVLNSHRRKLGAKRIKVIIEAPKLSTGCPDRHLDSLVNK